LYARSRKVGCLDRKEMEKRGDGKAEIHVLSASWIYSFRRRTQTTHNQPNITFSVCEIADGELEYMKNTTTVSIQKPQRLVQLHIMLEERSCWYMYD
jgi:hypothetical protein